MISWRLWTYFPFTQRRVTTDYHIWRVVICPCYFICFRNEKWVSSLVQGVSLSCLQYTFIFFWQTSPMTLHPSRWLISLTSRATSLLRCQQNKIYCRPLPLSFLWFFHLLEPLSFLTSPNVTNLRHSSPSRLHLTIRLLRFWARACHPYGSQAYLCL